MKQDHNALNTSETQYLLHPPQERKSSSNKDRYLTLLGGVCIHLVLGTFYLWGAIALYVASYLRSFDHTVTISELMSVPPLTIIGMNIGQIFGVPLAERFGPRIIVFASVLTISLAVCASSTATSYGLFVALYGILNGFTTGIAYMIPLVCGWKYYPKNKGLVSGITIGAFGFGAFIFNFVATGIVNPNDDKPGADGYFTEDVYEKVPRMLVILSICYIILGAVGTFLIRVPEKEEEVKKVVNESQVQQSVTVTQEQGVSSVKEGVFSIPFWILFFLASCGATFGLLIANNYKVYGLTKISEDHLLTVIGSIGSVANGGTRPMWALLFDKFGFKKVYFVLALIQTVLAFTLDLIASSGIAYLIWVALILSCEGGHFSLLPSVSAKIFGLKFGPRIYGIMFWCFAVATWSQLGFSKIALGGVGWSTVFYITGGISFVAFILNLFVTEDIPKKELV